MATDQLVHSQTWGDFEREELDGGKWIKYSFLDEDGTPIGERVFPGFQIISNAVIEASDQEDDPERSRTIKVRPNPPIIPPPKPPQE